MNGFSADPDAVRRHATRITEHGEQVHHALRALRGELDWLGDCWGDDEVGAGFARAHAGPAADTLAALHDAGSDLTDAARRFTATADDYTGTEQDNANRFRGSPGSSGSSGASGASGATAG